MTESRGKKMTEKGKPSNCPVCGGELMAQEASCHKCGWTKSGVLLSDRTSEAFWDYCEKLEAEKAKTATTQSASYPTHYKKRLQMLGEPDMTCNNCVFFCRQDPSSVLDKDGECRYTTPGTYGWSQVNSSDWCGRFCSRCDN